MRREFSLFLVFTLLALPAHGQVQTGREIIPEGTVIQLSLTDPLSSKLNEPGDRVTATVRNDVTVDGRTLLPKGTEISGRVTQVQPAGRPFKGGQLHITFERAIIDGQPYKLSAIIQSASDFSRDEKVKSDSEGTLKGGTDGGKTLSNVMTAGGLGTLGAMVVILASSRGGGGFGGFGIGRAGSVAGASVIGGSMIAGLLLTKGKEVRLDSSSIIRLKLARPIVIE
ncbi:MAG: hypothetical protein IPM66_23100 [Acidobacteriota bacterium]|nr:MAG: hypothetical protein IPM66_23100 [Acidobacteriota bacterium]